MTQQKRLWVIAHREAMRYLCALMKNKRVIKVRRDWAAMTLAKMVVR